MLAPGCVPSLVGTAGRGCSFARVPNQEDRVASLTEKQAELFRGKNWGTVVTLRKDGSPHSTPVWIDTDGESVIFNTAIGRAKERHLRRDPRAAVTVMPADDPQSGYVSVTGTAEISEEGANDH